MQTIALDAALMAIMDAHKTILKDAIAETDGGLESVRTLVMGDRARPRPDPPALWVMPMRARANHTSHGLAETWSLPVALIAVVLNDNPTTGHRDAMALAARGRKAILQYRNLGLGYVVDVVSTEFHPTREQADFANNAFAATSVHTVTFNVLER
jgi:hypothetical protein